jgi:hypothetical protein
VTVKGNGHGQVAPPGAEEGALRFVLEDAPDPRSRLTAARTLLREAKEAEWEERQRLARSRPEGVTPMQEAALLQARQALVQDAQAAVDDLLRRAGTLRQAIALAEEGLGAQRRLLARLRRELTEIGD